MNNPILTEPGVKYFLTNQFKNYKLFKENYMSFFINISLLILLSLIIFCFLYFSYKGKLTQKEALIKNEKKKQYILSKINKFNTFKNIHNNNITNLPNLEKM